MCNFINRFITIITCAIVEVEVAFNNKVATMYITGEILLLVSGYKYLTTYY